MSNIHAATKVADQLISRIFDQRHFTTGEINYLTRELDEKANLEENFDRILRINQNVCLALDTKTNDLCKTSDTIGQNFFDQATALHEKAQRILRIEEEAKLKEEKLLNEMRLERTKVRDDCCNATKSKLDKLKGSLLAEEQEIELKYRKFEEKLCNTGS